MEKKQYIMPEMRVVALSGTTLMDEGYSEDPTQTPEVSDTELDANRALFDTEQMPEPTHSVWE